MALSESDKAVVREIAFESARVISASLEKMVSLMIQVHQGTCPAGQALTYGQGAWKIIVIFTGIVGPFVGAAVALAAKHLIK